MAACQEYKLELPINALSVSYPTHCRAASWAVAERASDVRVGVLRECERERERERESDSE